MRPRACNRSALSLFIMGNLYLAAACWFFWAALSDAADVRWVPLALVLLYVWLGCRSLCIYYDRVRS
jgi:hypothetical protein